MNQQKLEQGIEINKEICHCRKVLDFFAKNGIHDIGFFPMEKRTHLTLACPDLVDLTIVYYKDRLADLSKEFNEL